MLWLGQAIIQTQLLQASLEFALWYTIAILYRNTLNTNNMSSNESSYESNSYLPDLPVIDWASIGHEPPRIIPFEYKGPTAPLPEADMVVMTWTDAEWSAFDHVFVDSRIPRGPNSSWEWQSAWKLYARNAPDVAPKLWGKYMIVGIKNKSGVEQ